MASGISYPIQGKYNPKGEKDAIKGISSITKAAKTFNLAVSGFVVAKVFQGINKVVPREYREAQKADSGEAENKL